MNRSYDEVFRYTEEYSASLQRCNLDLFRPLNVVDGPNMSKL